MVEWQTKRIVEYIAASVKTEKGKRNPLLESAQKLSLGLEDDDSSPESQEPREAVEEEKPEFFIEQGAPEAALKNRKGSFEALMQGLRS